MNKTVLFELFPCAARMWVCNGSRRVLASWLWYGANGGRIEIIRVDSPDFQHMVGLTIVEVMEGMSESSDTMVEFKLCDYASGMRDEYEKNYSPAFVDFIFDPESKHGKELLGPEAERIIAETVAAML